MRLFLDDESQLPGRNPGPGWVCVGTVVEAKLYLQEFKGQVTHLSLDSDLGTGIDDNDGPSLTYWLSEQWFVNGEDFWPTESCTIHSRNPNGRARMRADILNPRYNPRPEIFQDTLI